MNPSLFDLLIDIRDSLRNIEEALATPEVVKKSREYRKTERFIAKMRQENEGNYSAR